jgi:hypothetical protein
VPPSRGHHHAAAQRGARRLRDLAARQHQEPPRALGRGGRDRSQLWPTSTRTSTPTPSPRSWRCARSRTWARASALRHDSSTNAPDALDVLRMLHPTAAVGGIPARQRLRAHHVRLEQHDRGAFAGPVGWIDANGDGEWWIGLRGVLLKDREFEAWAGAGIVSESDPIAEREETKDKLAVVLTSLLSSASSDEEPSPSGTRSCPGAYQRSAAHFVTRTAPQRQCSWTSWTRRARGP